MIIIIDYGVGNLASIARALKRAGAEAQISGVDDDLRKAERLILPGVGNFASCMQRLQASGLLPTLTEAVRERGTLLLGICVGMQMLTGHSEEGDVPGLDWLGGRTRRLPDSVDGVAYRVPHVGWNAVSSSATPLFDGIADQERFYFTHSYYVECDDPELVIGRVNYGLEFAAAVRSGHVFGTQFHPEKSHQAGIALLRNFANSC